jgi:hypothetical protein
VYIYVRLQNCRQLDEVLHPEVSVSAYLTDVRQPYALRSNIAHHTRDVHNSERLDRCACIVEALLCLGGRWWQTKSGRTYRRWILVESRASTLLGGIAFHSDDHSLECCDMAEYSLLSGPHKTFLLHSPSALAESYRRGSVLPHREIEDNVTVRRSVGGRVSRKCAFHNRMVGCRHLNIRMCQSTPL